MPSFFVPMKPNDSVATLNSDDPCEHLIQSIARKEVQAVKNRVTLGEITDEEAKGQIIPIATRSLADAMQKDACKNRHK